MAWDYTSHYGSFGSVNPQEQDELWESIQVGLGNIALTEKEITKWSLPHSQPFPWDRERKMYLTAGYHNLHCIVSLEAK